MLNVSLDSYTYVYDLSTQFWSELSHLKIPRYHIWIFLSFYLLPIIFYIQQGHSATQNVVFFPCKFQDQINGGFKEKHEDDPLNPCTSVLLPLLSNFFHLTRLFMKHIFYIIYIYIYILAKFELPLKCPHAGSRTHVAPWNWGACGCLYI